MLIFIIQGWFYLEYSYPIIIPTDDQLPQSSFSFRYVQALFTNSKKMKTRVNDLKKIIKKIPVMSNGISIPGNCDNS